MLDQEFPTIGKILPKLTAYGTAIENGDDPTPHLDALKAQMYENSAGMWEAIHFAKNYQRSVIANPSGHPAYENPELAPSRLARLESLETYFDSPEFTGVVLAM